MSSENILEERLKSLTIAVGVKRKTIQLCKGLPMVKLLVIIIPIQLTQNKLYLNLQHIKFSNKALKKNKKLFVSLRS